MAKRFVWRLETVLKSKHRAEEQRQQDLAQALSQLNAEQSERIRILDLQMRCRQDLKQFQTGRLNVADLAQINTHLEVLDQQCRRVEARIKNAQNAVDATRGKLAQAVRERQVLENLKTQDHQTFRKAERKRDQAMMDELAARRKWYE
ncbi:MAG: flagellar export protein FliJ [Candidatus Latescibacterota bacterium]|jgi:flagellar export protein FliJ